MAVRTMVVKLAKNQMKCAMWQTRHVWRFAACENGLRFQHATLDMLPTEQEMWLLSTTVIFQQCWMNLSCFDLPITYL
jgi:hypothetical protein